VGQLFLDRDGGGLRHLLDGKAVHAGDLLELKLDDGTWLKGRYEWTFEGDTLPRFHLGLAGEPPGQPTDEGAIPIPTWAILRWPKDSRK
jgi:hypothetical protein